MRGGHHIKSWSTTQKKITLSSGEAELAACVKTSCECIGILQMAADWGRTVEGKVMVDSSAALGVVSRKGNGRLRHVRVGQLWIQQMAEDEEVIYRKILGDDNPADLFTKHLTRIRLDHLLDLISIRDEIGRAKESLEV